MAYWLMKSEPDVYSIDDMQKDHKAEWEGVRNYQARNFMRDTMEVGDFALFYNSNAKPPGVAGVVKIVETNVPDFHAWDPDSKYYDPKSTEENPRWFMVYVEFVRKFDQLIPLNELKANPNLEGMLVTKKGQRLSIQPVEKKHFDEVLSMTEG